MQTSARNKRFVLELADEPFDHRSLSSANSDDPPPIYSEGNIMVEQEISLTDEPTYQAWEPRTGICITLPSSAPVPNGFETPIPNRPVAILSRESRLASPVPTYHSNNSGSRFYKPRSSHPSTLTTTVSSCPANTPPSSKTNRGGRTYVLVAIMIFCALFVVWVCTKSFQ